MPARRASHIKLIAFAALLSGTACSRGSAPRESAADSTVPAVASAAETHPAAEMPAVPWTEEEARLQSPDGSVVTLEADYTTGPRTAYVKVDGRRTRWSTGCACRTGGIRPGGWCRAAWCGAVSVPGPSR
ncbi:MAG TPA: hypothetical protein VFT45_08630 [Longimicrobium sp.]|nr:hypothetical protein [Longimicrobium sp.]